MLGWVLVNGKEKSCRLVLVKGLDMFLCGSWLCVSTFGAVRGSCGQV